MRIPPGLKIAVKTMASSPRAEGPLFTLNAISSHLESLGYPETSLKSIKKCGVSSGFKIIARCGCGTRLIPLNYHCNNRVCPSCSKIRRNRILRKFLPMLKSFSINPHSKDKLVFLTISPQNFSNVTGISKVRRHFSKFMRLKYIKERIKGGLLIIETKTKNIHGEYRGWNIHLHAIIYGRFLDNRIRGKCSGCNQSLLKFNRTSKKYYCANHNCLSTNVISFGDSKLVRLWKESSGMACHMWVDPIRSYKGSLIYVSKYIASNKNDFFSLDHLAIYVNAIQKQKLISTFGCFFKFKFVKSPYLCHRCNEPIEFIFDIEIIALFERNPIPVNPPPTAYI